MKKRYLKEILCLTVFMVSLFFAAGLSAQERQQIPEGSTASSEQQGIQLKERMDTQQRSLKPVADVRLDVEINNLSKLPGDLEGRYFLINKISVEGCNINDIKKEFDMIVQGYTKRNVSLDELSKLTRELANEYGLKGYPAPKVFIPAQVIQKGVLKINIIEAADKPATK